MEKINDSWSSDSRRNNALMFNFHYTQMNFYLELFYSDTDSFIYVVKTNDVFDKLKEISEQFEFSFFSKTSPLYSDSIRHKVLKWKDEFAGKIIQEFVCLKPKLYSLKIQICNSEEFGLTNNDINSKRNPLIEKRLTVNQ